MGICADNEKPYKFENATGSFPLRDPKVWENFMRSQIAAILKKGKWNIVFMPAHVGQPERNILEKIAADITAENEVSATFLYIYEYIRGDHAGRHETSLLLGLRPEIVRDNPSNGNPWASESKDLSSVEEGRKKVVEVVDKAVLKIKKEILAKKIFYDQYLPLCKDKSAGFSADAKWITTKDEKYENYYFLARKSFKLDSLPEKNILRISADTKYAVYVNGIFAGTGPTRGSHKYYYYDSYDIASLLKKGQNWLAVEIHSPVRNTFSAVPVMPAVIAEIEGVMVTDKSWEVIEDPSHNKKAVIYTGQSGFTELKDMNYDYPGWQTGEDKLKWDSAIEVGGTDNFEGRKLIPRAVDELTSDLILPACIVEYGFMPGGFDKDTPDYADRVSNELHFKQTLSSTDNLANICYKSGETIIVPPAGNAAVYVILDFGRTVFGHLSFDLECEADVIMDVSHDEVLIQDRLLGKYSQYNFTDRFITRKGRQKIDQRLFSRGMRYLQLSFRNIQKPIKIHSAGIFNRIYPQAAAATFECSDVFMNKLWDISVETIKLCSIDTFVDCPWREQAFWLNDHSVVNLFYLLLTCDDVFAAHNIKIGADAALPNGWIPAVYPSKRSEKQLFPSLPAMWTIVLSDFYMYSGNLDFVKTMLPAMEKTLSLYNEWRDIDHLVAEQPDVWNFIDWGYRVEFKGKTAILNMLIAAAYKRAAILEQAVDNGKKAEEYLVKSKLTLTAINDNLWNAENGCYNDCTEPVGENTHSQHPLAVGLYFDLLEDPQKELALNSLINNETLIKAELYFQHYVVSAIAKYGTTKQALNIIHNLWGIMIEKDAVTVWENYEGRTPRRACYSSCHAFACAPLYFMQAFVLGIKPEAPGFKEFSFNPDPMQYNFVKGKVPTPFGDIEVELPKGQDEILLTIPDGTIALLKDGGKLMPGQHKIKV